MAPTPAGQRRPFAVTLAGALLAMHGTWAPGARAQSKGALAEQLFTQGQRLLEAGKVHEACESLASSQRLDPALGTLINLAYCHEREGKTASAWSEYTDAATQAARAGERDREGFAREHASALAKRLSKIVLEVKSPPPGTRIELDGVTLPSTTLGTELPVDPGDHVAVVSAPGKRPWSSKPIRVGNGPSVVRVAVQLEDDRAVVSSSPESGAGAGSGSRTLAYVIGGTGIAAPGAGVVLLARAYAFDQKSKSEATKANMFSPPDPTFREAALADHAEASAHQTAGFVVGGIGAAALGTGLVLLLLPKGAASTSQAQVTPTLLPTLLPTFGPSFAGLSARGVL